MVGSRHAREEEGIRVSGLQVQERAFAIWEREDRPHGRDLIHWFQAEAEISSPFPESDFREFVKAGSAFFRGLVSDETLSDQSERLRHFEWSSQAVRYRYRLCTECCGEFKAILSNPSEAWGAGWADEELNYKLERCIYVFAVSAVSALESFSFGLYFLGNALRPSDFPHFAQPRRIRIDGRDGTSNAFAAAFPHTAITQQLLQLPTKTEYLDIDALRNILVHRTSGRRNVQVIGVTDPDGTRTETREEFWYVPGGGRPLILSDALLQKHLENITKLLTTLASASRLFAESGGVA